MKELGLVEHAGKWLRIAR
jgi:hypothetical protein